MKYPIGIQNFGEVRRGGYAYVDKTALMWKMIDEGKYYFLSRPRRFGKSLLLSTIEAYFSGEKELFCGLAVAEREQQWTRHPILHLDLNAEKYVDSASLFVILNNQLAQWERLYGAEPTEESLSTRFMGVIRRAFEQTGRQVVILVDEYDKPLLQAIGNESLQDDYRATLKAFYGALKSCDRYIRFALLTGVTKFGRISVFSDLNNLFDLSFDRRYTSLCGITEQELHHYFDEGVHELAAANGMTADECYARLRDDFDGYHFDVDTPGMYNPFSLLNTLASQQFRDYWFETGTPSFLVEQLKRTDYPLDQMTEEELSADTLNSIDIMDTNPLPLLYQSGYLTIKDYDHRFRTYRMGFPNREVREGFVKYLVPFYTPTRNKKSLFEVVQFVNEVEKGDAAGFLRRLEALFANGDYQVMGDREVYFQNVMYVVFTMMGFYVDVERHTTDGRMDLVMQTPGYVYLFEMKVNRSAEAALRQIDEKNYAAAFAADPRRLFKIGINFDTETRRIECVLRERET